MPLHVPARALAAFCGTFPPRCRRKRHADGRERLRGAEVQGPENVAFAPQGRMPYTGVADGRVVFWDGKRWVPFATASPRWTQELCGGPKASPLEYLPNEHICGRPLGLRFDKKTGDLYIADAYFGLLKVGPEGGLATPLATEAEGVRLNFTNDLDLDDEGNVYFTDSSIHYQRRSVMPCPRSLPSALLGWLDAHLIPSTVVLTMGLVIGNIPPSLD